MKKLIILLLLVSNAFSQNTISIIPKPLSIIEGKGSFLIDNNTKIIIPTINEKVLLIATDLANKIKSVGDKTIEISTKDDAKNVIAFIENKGLTNEAYILKVEKNRIEIESSSLEGYFYAYQTLLQLLPVEIFGNSLVSNINFEVPICTITDKPRFAYRGVMLDVSRHFFPKEFIKKFIDELAIHKINTFHWHLTDDQGWRIEIKKYPKLTEVGSIRKESMKGHYRDQTYDNTPHEGFYSQADIKEIVAYAQRKYITIIPEIEMPGHALAALASYPELACTKGPFEVGTKWGVEERVFCPTEKTFGFLEDVLTEVMELFPSKYIHIGGDECPKKTWENSAFCQNLIKTHKLKDEHGLQSYFISRIDKFVSSKGRKIIGWDEILEGGLSENATVMSWRGEEGGIAAAKLKHDVIMSPNTYLYLDYYQSDPQNEPLAIGGFLPLEKTYSYEPLSSKLSKEESKYIIGVQANLWTEYIESPEKVEYMMFPRAIALAEIGWSSSKKDYLDFTNRLKHHFGRLDNMAVNYANAIYDITFETKKNGNKLPMLALSSSEKNAHIRYTLDGSIPNDISLKYDPLTNIVIDGDRIISAALFSENGKQLSKINTKSYVITKSTGKSYKILNPAKKYTGGETFALTNGIRGDIYNLNTWVGFEGGNFNCTIDLEEKSRIDEVKIGFLGAYNSWVLPPRNVEVQVSNDNKVFKTVKSIPLGANDGKANFVQQLNISFEPQNCRYVRILAENYGALPKYHPGEGKPAWLFVDEISIK